jgi:hypothetical protein
MFRPDSTLSWSLSISFFEKGFTSLNKFKVSHLYPKSLANWFELEFCLKLD